MHQLTALREYETIENNKLDPSVFIPSHPTNQNSRIGSSSKTSLLPFAFNPLQERQTQTQDSEETIPRRPRSSNSGTESQEIGKEMTRSLASFGTRNSNLDLILFSELDKKVLKSLLYSSGRASSLSMSRKFEIPLTTVQRKRRRLEGEFLEMSYTLKPDRLGLRVADMLISTRKGTSSLVGKELLKLSCITRVRRTIGEHTIDLHAQAWFRSNQDLSKIIEWIKSLDGVNRVVWIEAVEVIGDNTSIQDEIIDGHFQMKHITP